MCYKQVRQKPVDSEWNIKEEMDAVLWLEPNSWLFSSRLYVEGKLDYGEYTDKNNVRRQATTIIAGEEQYTVPLCLFKWKGGGEPLKYSLVCLQNPWLRIFAVSGLYH